MAADNDIELDANGDVALVPTAAQEALRELADAVTNPISMRIGALVAAERDRGYVGPLVPAMLTPSEIFRGQGFDVQRAGTILLETNEVTLRPGDMVAMGHGGLIGAARSSDMSPAIGRVERVELNPDGVAPMRAWVRLDTMADQIQRQRSADRAASERTMPRWISGAGGHVYVPTPPPAGWELWRDWRVGGRPDGSSGHYHGGIKRRARYFPGLYARSPGEIANLALHVVLAARGARTVQKRPTAIEARTDAQFIAMGVLSPEDVRRDRFAQFVVERSYRRSDLRRALRSLEPLLAVASDAMMTSDRPAAIRVLCEMVPLAVAISFTDYHDAGPSVAPVAVRAKRRVRRREAAECRYTQHMLVDDPNPPTFDPEIVEAWARAVGIPPIPGLPDSDPDAT